jgi:hypothetical protein
MKDLYRLNKLIREMNHALKLNTMHLNKAIRDGNFTEQHKHMFVRQELFKSIAHYQGQVIRVYEDALMSNVTPIRRKAA